MTFCLVTDQSERPEPPLASTKLSLIDHAFQTPRKSRYFNSEYIWCKARLRSILSLFYYGLLLASAIYGMCGAALIVASCTFTCTTKKTTYVRTLKLFSAINE